MTYLVNEACVKCKYTDCVSVCPVDCFYEGENTLVINPVECIDCGVCEPECPAGAIIADTDSKYDQEYIIKWTKINQAYSDAWPNIAEQKDPLPDADKFNPNLGYDGPDKTYELSDKPGGQ